MAHTLCTIRASAAASKSGRSDSAHAMKLYTGAIDGDCSELLRSQSAPGEVNVGQLSGSRQFAAQGKNLTSENPVMASSVHACRVSRPDTRQQATAAPQLPEAMASHGQTNRKRISSCENSNGARAFWPGHRASWRVHGQSSVRRRDGAGRQRAKGIVQV